MNKLKEWINEWMHDYGLSLERNNLVILAEISGIN